MTEMGFEEGARPTAFAYKPFCHTHARHASTMNEPQALRSHALVCAAYRYIQMCAHVQVCMHTHMTQTPVHRFLQAARVLQAHTVGSRRVSLCERYSYYTQSAARRHRRAHYV